MYMPFKNTVLAAIIFSLVMQLIATTGVYASEASYELAPDTQTATVGSIVDVDIILDTDGARTGAADVFVSFPRKKLELVDIEDGTIFGQYVGKVIDNRNGTGGISGLASLGDTIEYFSGEDTFATLRFRALSPGTAYVNVNFIPGSIHDRNNVSDADIMVDIENPESTDILETVSNAEIVIPDTGLPTIPATADIWTGDQLCDVCGKCNGDSENSPSSYASCISCMYEEAGPPPQGLKKGVSWNGDMCVKTTESSGLTASALRIAAIGGILSYAVMMYGGYITYKAKRHTKKRNQGKLLMATGGIALLLIVLVTILLQAGA